MILSEFLFQPASFPAHFFYSLLPFLLRFSMAAVTSMVPMASVISPLASASRSAVLTVIRAGSILARSTIDHSIMLMAGLCLTAFHGTRLIPVADTCRCQRRKRHTQYNSRCKNAGYYFLHKFISSFHFLFSFKEYDGSLPKCRV